MTIISSHMISDIVDPKNNRRLQRIAKFIGQNNNYNNGFFYTESCQYISKKNFKYLGAQNLLKCMIMMLKAYFMMAAKHPVKYIGNSVWCMILFFVLTAWVRSLICTLWSTFNTCSFSPLPSNMKNIIDVAYNRFYN